MRFHLKANVQSMPVKLHSLRFENSGAPAFVIMHGLLGASRNWTTIGKALQNQFDVHVLDLRNHGDSPHAESMRWAELVADLRLYLESEAPDESVLMGHSLGGKIAMKFACSHPGRVKKLIILDIAARAYPPYYDTEFRAMKRILPGALENRREAEELLKPLITDRVMRQFLMMNLVRGEFGLEWKINLEALYASLPVLRQNPLSGKDRFQKPCLLVTGGKTDFVQGSDVSDMRTWFADLTHHALPTAGHNVHIDDRKGFLDAVLGWI